MVKPALKCGNSNAVYNAASNAKADEVARRQTVRIHFPASVPVSGGFRVIARLVDGREVLLATADTHADAVSAAWARTADVPANAASLAIEQWEGTCTAGRWVNAPTRAKELPKLPPPVKGIRHLSRRARKWFGA